MGCTSSFPVTSYGAINEVFEKVEVVASMGTGSPGKDAATFGVSRIGASVAKLNSVYGVGDWGDMCLHQCRIFDLRMQINIYTSAAGVEIQFAFPKSSIEIPSSLERFVESSPLKLVAESVDYPGVEKIVTYKVEQPVEDPIPSIVEHFKRDYESVRKLMGALAPRSA